VVDDAGVVVGYFAIAPHLLARDDASVRLARGAPDRIPAILLAKLALDSSVQGRGLGSELLVVALGVIVAAAKRAGGRIVLVDATSDDAREFYERHDFERLPGHTHRLFMKLSSVANALGVPWP
jgi:GNAT superfamily N-acetyltransferase